ncbi:Do family serine endopeptidase [candidate division WOR-3 bacterium]|nr:Do family serine endopeptidase [candidate division WOR-3 bacterium]
MKTNRGYIAGAAFTALVAIMAFIMGLVIASNINIFQGKNTEEIIAQDIFPHHNPETIVSIKSPFSPIAKAILPVVVNISAERTIKIRTPFFDFPFEEFFGKTPQELERKAKSLGSGIIFSEKGYILTNNHVVAGADNIIITLSDNAVFKGNEVTVIGTDPSTDIAILKINTKNKMQYARLGDSDKIEIGDWAIAFGSPFGFSQTMTVGIISAKGRTHIPLSHGPTYQDFIQTDAAINSGNSGGPLVNINGEVIGINTAIASPSGGNVGIGFAIPINLVKSITEQLIKEGKITRGWLGISIQELTPEIATGLGLDITKGVIVAKVLSGSPAEKGRLKDGDIIIKLNGETVEDIDKFKLMVASITPKKRVNIIVIRGKEELTLTVKIGEMPDKTEIIKSDEKEEGWLGLSVENTSPDSKEYGVIVKKVTANSSADEASIEAGDIIKRVGNIYIRDLNDFKKAKNTYDKYSHITFQIKKRNGYVVFVAVKQ